MYSVLVRIAASLNKTNTTVVSLLDTLIVYNIPSLPVTDE